MPILPEQTTALANAIPEGGYSAKQLIDAYKTSDATYALNSGNQNDLYASSRDARGAVSTASQKLDQNIARTTGTPVETPAETPANPNQQTIYVDQNFADTHDMNNPAFKNYKVRASSETPALPGTTPTPESTEAARQTAAGTAQSGTQTEDPYAKAMSDYNTLLDQNAADRTTKDAEWQSRLDETQKSLISSIEKKYEARRLKMQDTNARMLEGKRIAGISAGRSRYAPGMEEGLLSTEEMDGQARLAEIDAEELSLIAQAKQARDEASYNAFVQSMDRVDALAKEKLDVITKLHENAVAQDKALDEKRRNAITEEQNVLNLAQDKATSYAKGAYEKLATMKTEEEKMKYITELATAQKLPVEVLQGAITDYANKEETQASQIAARESAASAREQNISLAEQRLLLQKEKQDTTDEKLPTVSVAVGNSIQYFIDMMKEKGWRGINPDEYKKISETLRKNYGGNAVRELDKAIEDANLIVDNEK